MVRGFWPLVKLNARNFAISVQGRASKNMSNDTKLKAISWELDIENLFFDFCVGVWEGGNIPTIVRMENQAKKLITANKT